MRFFVPAVLFVGALAAPKGDNGCRDGRHPWSRVQHDVLVIGGGPAGLQSAMSLARLGRSVLLVDNQKYRNAATLRMHDVPALDGTPPPVFRAEARENLKDYSTITYSEATIVSIENVRNGTLFVSHGQNGEKFSTRKVVLATGMTDELPAIEGIKDVWGIGAFWCPFCDGFEHRNGELGVLTTDELDDAIYVHELNSKQTTLLTNGARVSPAALNKQFFDGVLAAAKAVGIKWEYRKILRVAYVNPRDREHSPVRVFFTDASYRDFKGLLIKTVRRIHSFNLVKSLGVKTRGEGEKVFIDTASFGNGRSGSTSVFGVYAAGDNIQENQSVATALRAGKLTGITLVHELGKEEALAAAGYDWRGEHGRCH